MTITLPLFTPFFIVLPQFTSAQVGLDIATSMTIVACAVTLLINPKRKNDQAQLLACFKKASQALSNFVHEVHADRYQRFPLLDTLRNGQKEIAQFKKNLDALMALYNDIQRNATPLAIELEKVLERARQKPFNELSPQARDTLIHMGRQIMENKRYAHWVHPFIADEDETRYWLPGDEDAAAVRLKALQQFTGLACEHPSPLRAQRFVQVYRRLRLGHAKCKELLIALTAIHHALLFREGTHAAEEAPTATAKRDVGEDPFALAIEIR